MSNKRGEFRRLFFIVLVITTLLTLMITAFDFEDNLININSVTFVNITVNSSSGYHSVNENLMCHVVAVEDASVDISYNGFWYKEGVQQFYYKNITEGGANFDYVDWYNHLVLDSSDNIYVASYTNTSGAGGYDVWLLKYDPNFNLYWNVTIGGIGDDQADGINIDSIGNIIVTGYTESEGAGGTDVWTVKYDSDGNYLWNATIGGAGADYGLDILTDSSDNIYIGGYTWSFGNGFSDFWIIKYDSDGNYLWNVTHGGTGIEEEDEIEWDSEGNIILAGRSTSFGEGGYDVWILKLDNAGNQIWNTTFGSTINDDIYGLGVDSGDNIIITGYNVSRTYTAKLDSGGSLDWFRVSETVQQDDYGLGLAIDSNDSIIVVGTKADDTTGLYYGGWLTKYNSSGSQVLNLTKSLSASDDGFSNVALDSNENIVIAGFVDVANYDFWLVKYYGFNLSNQDSGSSQLLDTLDSGNLTVTDEWSCQIRAYNGTNYTTYNTSNFVIITDNAAPPNVTLFLLANGSVTSDINPTLVWINGTDIDGGQQNFTLEIYNSTTFTEIYKVLYNGSITRENITLPSALSDGSYYWRVLSFDGTLNSTWSENWTFIIDSTAPNVTYAPVTSFMEENGTFFNREWIFFNLSALYDLHFANVTVRLWNSSVKEVNTTIFYNNETTWLNFTNHSDSSEGLNEGEYYLSVTAYDNASLSVTLDNRTIILDRTTPLVTYDSTTEANDTGVNKGWILINVSELVDPLIAGRNYNANVTFSLYNSTGLVNKTIFYNNATLWLNITNHTNNGDGTTAGLSDGIYRYNVTIRDNASNINSTSIRTIILDQTSPTIDYGNQVLANGTYVDQDSIFVNVSVVENVAVANVTFRLYNLIDGSMVNTTTFSNNGSTLFANFTGLDKGKKYLFNVTVTDNGSNKVVTANRMQILDNVAPALTLTISDTTLNQYAQPTLTCIGTDGLGDTNLTGAVITVTKPNGDTTTVTSGNLLESTHTGTTGTYTVDCTLQDTAGNQGSTSSTFTVSYSTTGSGGSGGGSDGDDDSEEKVDDNGVDEIEEELEEPIILDKIINIDLDLFDIGNPLSFNILRERNVTTILFRPGFNLIIDFNGTKPSFTINLDSGEQKSIPDED